MRVMKPVEAAQSEAESVRDEGLERAYLTALLRGGHLDESPLPPEALTHPLHRLLYEAMGRAHERLKKVDVATVRAVLTREGAAPEAVELVELLAAGDANPANLDGYTAGLLEYHAKRVSIRAMEGGIRAMKSPSARADVVASEVAAVLGSASLDGAEGRGGDDARSLKADVQEERQQRADDKVQQRSFLPLPFAGFNREATRMRGFPSRKKASCLGVIAARSGKGKTATVATLMHYWLCELGFVLGLVGLEDGTRWLVERWVARDFGLDWGNVVEEGAAGNLYVMPFQVPWFPEDWAEPHPETGQACFSFDRVVECYEYLLDQRLRRYEGGSISSPRLVALARKWEREGVQGILVDHGLQVDYAVGADERLDLAIKRGVKALNGFTMETGCPVILAWHLNRKSDDDAPPAMDDVKESGYLDAYCATMFGIYYHAGSGRTLLNVPKSRKSGGIGGILELVWAGRSGMFYPSQCEAVDLRAEAKKAREAAKAERNGKKLF